MAEDTARLMVRILGDASDYAQTTTEAAEATQTVTEATQELTAAQEHQVTITETLGQYIANVADHLQGVDWLGAADDVVELTEFVNDFTTSLEEVTGFEMGEGFHDLVSATGEAAENVGSLATAIASGDIMGTLQGIVDTSIAIQVLVRRWVEARGYTDDIVGYEDMTDREQRGTSLNEFAANLPLIGPALASMTGYDPRSAAGAVTDAERSRFSSYADPDLIETNRRTAEAIERISFETLSI